MKYRTSDEIRQLFLDYFNDKKHEVVASHPLIPADDPTLLFVNAGMVQFKDIFVGRKEVPYVRACSSQKCLRVSGKHNDLENVGRTARHHTFFEMLGNFSFGDYFKRDAILYAWEFLTSPAYMGLPIEKLWVTVHPEDVEAAEIWRNEAGVAPNRILVDESNFWAMGDTGPCGPCSEIHIDQGKELSGGVEVPFGQGGDRYLELWNLVFMQFERDASGALIPLPKPSIDTGMGLERISAIVQGKTANYGADLFQPLIDKVSKISGRTYQARFGDPDKREAEIEEDVAFRVIADHARAATFLIADGIYPENEGRGYVLRRVMRRAIRFGRKLGMETEFLYQICDSVVDRMGAHYPELYKARDVISRVVRLEEERFGKTLVDGLRLLENEMSRLKEQSRTVVPGETVFTLYDTHGFPVDLTRLIAEEQDFSVDEVGFSTAMQAQRDRGRASWKGLDTADITIYENLANENVHTTFVGYEWDQVETPLLAMVMDGRRVEQAEAGNIVEVFTAQTPFYPEGGGQVGDRGTLFSEFGAVLEVTDTIRRGPTIAHLCVVKSGTVRVADNLNLQINTGIRQPTRKNHSATHLLHWALRKVLGEHVKQRGSLVAPDRLRFDFSHFGPLNAKEIAEIEHLVNERVVANTPVHSQNMAYNDAIMQGAIAFFGEKYGTEVRVISMAESVELCGGTHVAATGDIGLFKIIHETGISAGVRRIEAITGLTALDWVQSREKQLQTLAGTLKTSPSLLDRKIEKLLQELESAHREIDQLKNQLRAGSAHDYLTDVRQIGDVNTLAISLDGVESKELRVLSDEIMAKLGRGVLLLGSKHDGKLAILTSVSPDLTTVLDAGQLISELAPIVGGRGGGKKQLAQAGGTISEAFPDAIARFYSLVEARCEKTAINC